MWINLISLAANVALNLWWIPLAGIAGAGLASTCSYGLGAILILRWTARITAVPFPDSIRPRWSDAADAWAGLASLLRPRAAVKP
jgi:O-antigen/teichoic acid export membrane protein